VTKDRWLVNEQGMSISLPRTDSFLKVPSNNSNRSSRVSRSNRSGEYPLITLSRSVYVSEQNVFQRILKFLVSSKRDIRCIKIVCKPWNRALRKIEVSLLCQLQDEEMDRVANLPSSTKSGLYKYHTPHHSETTMSGFSSRNSSFGNNLNELELKIPDPDPSETRARMAERRLSEETQASEIPHSGSFLHALQSLFFGTNPAEPSPNSRSDHKDDDHSYSNIHSNRPFVKITPQFWTYADAKENGGLMEDSEQAPSPKFAFNASDEEHSTSNSSDVSPRKSRRSASHIGIVDPAEVSKWRNLKKVDEMYISLKKSRSRSSMHASNSSPSVADASSREHTPHSIEKSPEKSPLSLPNSPLAENGDVYRFWESVVLPQWELLSKTAVVLRDWNLYG
jgi:hypothetical protein